MAFDLLLVSSGNLAALRRCFSVDSLRGRPVAHKGGKEIRCLTFTGLSLLSAVELMGSAPGQYPPHWLRLRRLHVESAKSFEA